MTNDCMLYFDGVTWFSRSPFPLTALDELMPYVTDWIVFGRLNRLEEPSCRLYPIELPRPSRVEFIGAWNQRRGPAGYVLNLRSYVTALSYAIRSADIVWMKMPSVAGLVAGFLLTPRQISVIQVIGEFRVGLVAIYGRWWAVPSLLMEKIWRSHLRKADLCVFVSRFLAERYGKNLGNVLIANESALRKQMIVDRRNLWQVHTPARVLYVGRLSPEKGCEDLVRVGAELKRQGISLELWFIGDGPLKTRIADMSASLGISVRLIGSLPWGEKLFQKMREADVLVLPSRTEGLGLVLLEAMSQGVPVVASAVGGIPEIVQDQVTGLLVRPRDIQGFASAIRTVLIDADVRRRLIENGLEMASRNTLELQTGKVVSAIEELIQKKGLRPGTG